jgi:hypothetical protein
MSPHQNLEKVEKQIDTAIRIKDKVKNEDFDWGLLLPKSEPKLHLSYLVASILCYFISTVLMIFYNEENGKAYQIIFATGLMSLLWMASCIHLRIDKGSVTSMATIIPLIIFIVSSGLMTPKEAVDEIKDILSQETSATPSEIKPSEK